MYRRVAPIVSTKLPYSQPRKGRIQPNIGDFLRAQTLPKHFHGTPRPVVVSHARQCGAGKQLKSIETEEWIGDVSVSRSVVAPPAQGRGKREEYFPKPNSEVIRPAILSRTIDFAKTAFRPLSFSTTSLKRTKSRYAMNSCFQRETN